MKKQRSIVFDLDGTLIDSAPSILASMQAAFTNIGIQPIRPFTSDLIGPPLAKTLTTLVRQEHVAVLPELIEAFKTHYDETGYQNTTAYAGVQSMLEQLLYHSNGLYVATNKRISPTRRIVQHLGWISYFKGLYALDYYSPPVSEKAEMLQRVRDQLQEGAGEVIYIGDRLEDADAANSSNIPFIMAAWGYGARNSTTSVMRIATSPLELVDAIATF